MPSSNPSLYETLLQNFADDLNLPLVREQDQLVLSVLDNLQRILNSRAGTLAHLPDYGLPDMGHILQGLPAAAHSLMNTVSLTLLKYEPRLSGLTMRLTPQSQPGHLTYSLEACLQNGEQVTFGTTLTPEGKVLVRHLKQRQYVAS